MSRDAAYHVDRRAAAGAHRRRRAVARRDAAERARRGSRARHDARDRRARLRASWRALGCSTPRRGGRRGSPATAPLARAPRAARRAGAAARRQRRPAARPDRRRRRPRRRAGSFGGLSALWQRRADAATLHLRHRDGAYNAPFAARVLARPRAGARAPLAARAGHHPPARQPGRHRGVDRPDRPHGRAARRPAPAPACCSTACCARPARIPRRCGGRRRRTHLEAAIAVAAGLADAAIGLRAAAATFELDFVPLAWEPFELALPEASLAAAGDLLAALGSVAPLPGFDLSESGTTRRPLNWSGMHDARETARRPRRGCLRRFLQLSAMSAGVCPWRRRA